MEVSGKLADTGQDLQLCEHCLFENVTTKANGICRDCEEYMCDTSFCHHLKGRKNRNHELIDMNDPDIAARKISEEVEKCEKHDNEAIKFCCRKHEIVGCGDCFALEHRTCTPEYIKDISENVHETVPFINLKRTIEQLERQNKATYETVRKNRKDCKGMQEEVLTEIRKFRTDINTYLDKAEAAILSEMKQLMSDNDERLDKLDQECGKCTSKCEGLKQKLYPTVHRGNALFIKTVRCKASVLEIENELSKIVQSVSGIKGYEFVPNQKLSSIIESREKLGRLNISNINGPSQDEITNLEMNRDTLTFVEPKKPVQQETDRKTGITPPSVFVGARVKKEIRIGRVYLGERRGTVTAVRLDGTVDVKWDTGRTMSGYRVGKGPRSVVLI